MSENSNLAIGAGVGAAAGAGAGLAVGAKKAAGVLSQAGIKNGLVVIKDDQYVSSGIQKLVKSADYQAKNINQKINAKGSLSEKFKNVFSTTVEKAKSTKVKWAVGLAAAGAAVGVGIAAIVNKVKSNKEEA